MTKLDDEVLADRVPPWIEPRALGVLAAELGAHEWAAVLDEFLHELRSRRRELSGLDQWPDPARVKLIAHRLRGTSAYFGAERLRRCAQTLETELTSGSGGVPTRSIDAMVRCIAATTAVLEGMRRTGLAGAAPRVPKRMTPETA